MRALNTFLVCYDVKRLLACSTVENTPWNVIDRRDELTLSESMQNAWDSRS